MKNFILALAASFAFISVPAFAALEESEDFKNGYDAGTQACGEFACMLSWTEVHSPGRNVDFTVAFNGRTKSEVIQKVANYCNTVKENTGRSRENCHWYIKHDFLRCY